MFNHKQTDICVIGAGPVGLVAAHALADRKADFVQLDTSPGPHIHSYAQQPSPLTTKNESRNGTTCSASITCYVATAPTPGSCSIRINLPLICQPAETPESQSFSNSIWRVWRFSFPDYFYTQSARRSLRRFDPVPAWRDRRLVHAGVVHPKWLRLRRGGSRHNQSARRVGRRPSSR